VREFQVVGFPPPDAAGQGSVFTSEGAGGVGRGEQGVSDDGGLASDGGRRDGLVGVCGSGFVQGQQGAADLISPAPGVGSVGGGR